MFHKVRGRGAIPATIAIIKGDVHVGLERANLELLAREGAETFTKVSRQEPKRRSTLAPCGCHDGFRAD